MILYFSGTGNSAYAAKKIGQEIQDEIMDLFKKLRSRDYSPISTQRPWVIVTPTYAWRIPRFLEKWLERTPLSGNKDIYFVMTCGENIGNAGKYLKKFCDKKGMNYRGCFEIVMPENYIALFKTPDQNTGIKIIEKAQKPLRQAARMIKEGKPFPSSPVSVTGRLCSGIVNDFFYPFMVHAKKFYATDACISCGKCVKVCPMKNVRLENQRPVWGSRCTHSMACICRCPKEAIEYGKHSRGLPRYTCPK